MSNELSQECIGQIHKKWPKKTAGGWGGMNYSSDNELLRKGAIEALTNPVIYQSAGLMPVEEALRFVDSLRDYTSESHSILGHDDRTTTELLNIFRNQNKEK